jgi:hypothetical protein
MVPEPRLSLRGNDSYVKSEDGGYRSGVKRLLPLLAVAALAAPGTASAERVAEGVDEAALFAGANPIVAYVQGRELFTATRNATWTHARIAGLPDDSGRVAVIRPGAVLVESRAGLWLRCVARVNGRWRTVRIADAPKDGQLGPAGMTLNRGGRPAIAYSVRGRDDATELWLVQVGGNLRLNRTRVTRRGFPASRVPPAAVPLLMPNGTLRVVQTFSQRGANAIFWRREGNRWWGRVLHASALGVSGLPFSAALAAEDLYVAWTVAYATQRELHLVLTSRTDRSRSVVLHRNAISAGLVLGPNGPEVAANENVAGLTAGLVFFPGIVTGTIAPSPPVELDGKIVAYARDPIGRWQLLVARNGGLEWFVAPSLPYVRIFLDGPLSGRVEGAADGVVRIYRQRPGAERELVAEASVDANGRFTAVDPAPVSGTFYRLVYEREFPYALLVREPLP